MIQGVFDAESECLRQWPGLRSRKGIGGAGSATRDRDQPLTEDWGLAGRTSSSTGDLLSPGRFGVSEQRGNGESNEGVRTEPSIKVSSGPGKSAQRPLCPARNHSHVLKLKGGLSKVDCIRGQNRKEKSRCRHANKTPAKDSRETVLIHAKEIHMTLGVGR